MELELKELIRLAKAWADLGFAVNSQCEDVVNGANLDDMNPAALKMVQVWLLDASEVCPEAQEMADDITEYLSERVPQ